MEKTTKETLKLSEKYNRNFSEEFKKSKVKDLVNKTISIKTLSSLYGVSRTTVYNWLYLYSNIEKGTNTVVQMDSEQTKTLVLLKRVAELERIVGQKQLEIDFLDKTIELASDEVGFDLKKKFKPLP